jgi:hypothetical protein
MMIKKEASLTAAATGTGNNQQQSQNEFSIQHQNHTMPHQQLNNVNY